MMPVAIVVVRKIGVSSILESCDSNIGAAGD
jgi:hypothetical protein